MNCIEYGDDGTTVSLIDCFVVKESLRACLFGLFTFSVLFSTHGREERRILS